MRNISEYFIVSLCLFMLLPISAIAQDEEPVYLQRKVVDSDGNELPSDRQIPDVTFTSFLDGDMDSVLIENAPPWDGREGNWSSDFSLAGVELQNFYHFDSGDTAYIRFNDRISGQQGTYSQAIDSIPWSDPAPFDQIQLEDITVPQRPQNVSIDLSADYERTLTWDAKSGVEYWIYRRDREEAIFNGEMRNLYTLQTQGVTSGEWTDPNTSSQRKFAYIIYAVNTSGVFSAHSNEVSQERPTSETSVLVRRFVDNSNGNSISKEPPEITYTAFLNGKQDSLLLENSPGIDGNEVDNIDVTNGMVGIEMQVFPNFEARDTLHIRVTDTVLSEQGTLIQPIDSVPWNDPNPFRTLNLQSVNLPVAPQNVQLSVDNGQRTLTWNARSGVTYRVYRRSRKDTLLSGDQRNLYTLQEQGISSGSWTDPNTSTDASFAYVVYAENSSGVLSSHSSEVFKTRPVTGLTDSAVKSRNVSLTWDAFEPIIGKTAGYNIYRRQEGDATYGSPEAFTGTETHFTDSRLEPGQTYYYKVRPRNLDREEVGSAQEISVTTKSSGNYTTYANFKTAVVIYKNTNYRQGGDYQMSDQEVEEIKQLLEYGREFYWRNTKMQLNFEFDYIVVEEYKEMSGQSGESTRETGDHLENDYGVMNTQYDFVFRITPSTGGYWSWGATNLLGLPGPDRRTGFAQIQWPIGTGRFGAYPGEFPGVGIGYQIIWLFIHEGQHAVDGIYRHNNHFEMGHGDFPELYGNPDLQIGSEPGYPVGNYPPDYPQGWGVRFGKRFDFQATLLRDFKDYKDLASDWGEIIQAEDQDGDGFPDVDPKVPINEQTFGSDPTKADTDNDNYSDKQEAIDGIYHYSYSDPNDQDSDGDGIDDGDDPNPRYPMKLTVMRPGNEFTPVVDGSIEEWPEITMLNDTVSKSTENTSFSPEIYMVYNSDSLYFGLSMPKEAIPTVKWDFDANGRWYGAGNTNMVIDTDGSFRTLRTWDARDNIQQWLEDNRDRASGDGMWDNTNDYRSVFGNGIFRENNITLRSSANDRGGYDIEMAIPKNDLAGLSLEANQDIGLIVDYSGVGSSNAQATSFDQWSYEYLTLCDCTASDIQERGDEEIANKFKLEQNYPNPFNPSTTIQYSIPTSREVTLKVYNMLGREVATLINKKQSAGSYSVTFDAGDMSSGVYFYKLKAGQKQDVRKMLLLK